MKTEKNPVNFAPVAVFLLFFVPSDLFAYIDPGSGSYFIQIVIAALVGGAVTIKVFWRRIKDFFTSRLNRKRQKPKNE